jgi:hypothetical protein
LKGVIGLLNNEAHKNIEIIKVTAQSVWGENCILSDFKEDESLYPEFEWVLRLYDQFDVKLNYDRSTLSIGVPTKEGYMVLSRVAEEPVFRGFDGMKPENLLHNFQVLDRLLNKCRVENKGLPTSGYNSNKTKAKSDDPER